MQGPGAKRYCGYVKTSLPTVKSLDNWGGLSVREPPAGLLAHRTIYIWSSPRAPNFSICITLSRDPPLRP